jgi:hypothetical protein
MNPGGWIAAYHSRLLKLGNLVPEQAALNFMGMLE